LRGPKLCPSMFGKKVLDLGGETGGRGTKRKKKKKHGVGAKGFFCCPNHGSCEGQERGKNRGGKDRGRPHYEIKLEKEEGGKRTEGSGYSDVGLTPVAI